MRKRYRRVSGMDGKSIQGNGPVFYLGDNFRRFRKSTFHESGVHFAGNFTPDLVLARPENAHEFSGYGYKLRNLLNGADQKRS